MQHSEISVFAFTFAYYTCFLNYHKISEIYRRHFCDTMYGSVHLPSFGGTFKLRLLF
jgi:hypothetical protein